MHQIGNGVELESMRMHELCSSDGHKKILIRTEIKNKTFDSFETIRYDVI